jgi:hypothetical protein
MRRTSLRRSVSGIPVQKVCRLHNPHLIRDARKEVGNIAETVNTSRSTVQMPANAVTIVTPPRVTPEQAINETFPYSTPVIISRVAVPLTVQSNTR